MKEMKESYKRRKHKMKESKLSWRKQKEMKREQREQKLLDQMQPVGEKSGVNASANNDATKPIDVTRASKPANQFTLSIALPGSILDNAQSLELRTYLAGQIARAAVIFRVDEVIIFDEKAKLTDSQIQSFNEGALLSKQNGRADCNLLLGRILQYLETPQYLRKALFPLQTELKYAALSLLCVLNPLDCPHHLRSDDYSIHYREAIVLQKPVKHGHGSLCDAGLMKEIRIDREISPGIRVTLDIDYAKSKGKVVSPRAPVGEGYYWGYSIRVAKSLSAIFEQCPYTDASGYDCTLGTSERGKSVDELQMPNARHYLLVLGGVSGLESCLENDQSLTATDPSSLFNFYLNTCPQQGSRTIRTEEALLVTLSALRPKFL